jgi:hypothetical protein
MQHESQTQEAADFNDRRILVMGGTRGISEDAARQRITDSLGGIPLGRPNRPEEVAELVACIRKVASGRARAIDGVNGLRFYRLLANSLL